MSQRIDQFRDKFTNWIDSEIKRLDADWRSARESDEWIRAAGLAVELDTLQRVRDKVLPMTR